MLPTAEIYVYRLLKAPSEGSGWIVAKLNGDWRVLSEGLAGKNE